jgi:hypothetical protein
VFAHFEAIRKEHLRAKEQVPARQELPGEMASDYLLATYKVKKNFRVAPQKKLDRSLPAWYSLKRLTLSG